MSRDDLTDIPSFAASRDEGVTSMGRGAIPGRATRQPVSGNAHMGLMARLLITIAIIAGAVACAWAWQLQVAYELAAAEASNLGARVRDLEALLSDTDETVEKSAAALGAQLNVVDKEARRLEQRRREMDARIDKLESDAAKTASGIKKLDTNIDSNAKTLATVTDTIVQLQKELRALTQVAGDLERLGSIAKQSQTHLERLSDAVNKSNLERAALAKRIAANEEWIESINAFRRQVNTSINQLQNALRQNPPATGGAQAPPAG